MKYSIVEKEIQNNQNKIFGTAYMPITDKTTPIVIFSHGYNGRYNDFCHVMEYLAERGIASYGFDFCGASVHSKSSMKTTEMTIYTEVSDLKAVLNDVRTWETIDSSRIYLFGASQGGMVSALTAAECIEEVKGLMLLYPAFCIADDWREKFASVEDIPEEVELWGNMLGRKFFTEIRDLNPFDIIGKFAKKVEIYHGDKDDIVNLEYAKKAQKTYEDANLIIFPGEGHGFSPEGEKKVAEYVYQFVENVSL